jgi:hypothetical protein
VQPVAATGVDEGEEAVEILLLVDAEPAFHRHRHGHRRAHRGDAVGDQRRLLHQAGAEAAGLHAVGRATHVEVDLVVAESAPTRAAAASATGSLPPSCSATGCSLSSCPSRRSRSPCSTACAWTISV